MSDVKPVAWGLFARVDGKFVLQHPVRFSREYCERDVKMYGPDLVWNIQPLIAGGEVTALQAEIEALRKDAERYENALEQLRQWAQAYPLRVFPTPDFKKAHEVLTANGMTLDAISAFNMRHVITQVVAIVDAAIAKEKQQESLK